jgi:hypothetical protein
MVVLELTIDDHDRITAIDVVADPVKLGRLRLAMVAGEVGRSAAGSR